jgi:hypothetical protein
LLPTDDVDTAECCDVPNVLVTGFVKEHVIVRVVACAGGAKHFS